MSFSSDVSLSVISPERGLHEESLLFEKVANNELTSGYKIWRCQPSIVVPRSLSQKEGFRHAVDAMSGMGWPVFVRQTGGDLVPQSPGSLNVTLVFKRHKDKGSIKDTYLALCLPIINALAKMGISAHCAPIPGSFCDGDYNLVVGDQKLAGTAQRWRRVKSAENKNEFAVLVHAVILCSGNLQERWQVTNAFYAHCGIDKKIELTKHTSVAQLKPSASISDEERLKQLATTISQELNIIIR
ncbi:hypothetical protein L4D06_21840 [Enterovibrio makurazakiensis]|uniref:BPL/LPL catalytic domain-containing protein n=1 Tax=Enterovibrio gelatinilyticus TaxID=2899819 RepID=A0ABT5QXA2_9GAMM|nr:hypothetical protein [Enterovibrio sp. ZSDZ42]MDD1792235.1 hypothetical protein [Enterovibrio sp. ZSDZ42]